MRRADYDRFTAELTAWAETDPRVRGLVVLGSTASVGREPDEWSDHDFFVIGHDGTAAELRGDRSWLPDADRIVVHFRETEHGCSAVYDDGHLAEYAVFELHELEVAKVNDHRVLVDDGTVSRRLAEIAERTAGESATADPGDLFGAFVSQLVIGLTRYGRGERLSANHLVRGWAVRSLLATIESFGEPPGASVIDDLDPHRRVEVAYPALAGEIDAALVRPVPDLAATLVDIAEREIGPRVPAATPPAFAALRTLIDLVR